MGADLGILSGSTHQQKLTKSQQDSNHYLPNLPGGGSWMRNPKQAQEDDDSWEVRAFAEDTGHIMGAPWPPRSYTCTFCRREFRSAQALGGHMNVHRRDRARLHQTQPPSPSTFIISNQDFRANAGVCLLYQLPNPNGVFAPTGVNAFDHPSSTLLSIPPYPDQSKLLGKSLNFLETSQQVSSPHFYSSKPDIKADIVAAIDNSKSIGNSSSSSNKRKDLGTEELDLELRLGHRSKPGKLKLMTV